VAARRATVVRQRVAVIALLATLDLAVAALAQDHRGVGSGFPINTWRPISAVSASRVRTAHFRVCSCGASGSGHGGVDASRTGRVSTSATAVADSTCSATTATNWNVWPSASGVIGALVWHRVYGRSSTSASHSSRATDTAYSGNILGATGGGPVGWTGDGSIATRSTPSIHRGRGTHARSEGARRGTRLGTLLPGRARALHGEAGNALGALTPAAATAKGHEETGDHHAQSGYHVNHGLSIRASLQP
jgi:hypothetical protein